MYRLYVEKYEDSSETYSRVKYHYYSKVFNEFNLSFGYPKPDTCSIVVSIFSNPIFSIALPVVLTPLARLETLGCGMGSLGSGFLLCFLYTLSESSSNKFWYIITCTADYSQTCFA